jgi:hypothetical protein
MNLQTNRGEVDTADLVSTSGVEDSDRYYGPWLEYRFPDGELAARLEARDAAKGGFLKLNPFDPQINCLIDGQPAMRRESELVKAIGQVDNAQEYSCWVEYRLPGSDVIVHRSADVKLKKQQEAAAGAAGEI